MAFILWSVFLCAFVKFVTDDMHYIKRLRLVCQEEITYAG